MKAGTTILSAALLIASAAVASAQQRVTIVGCPSPGVEAKCLMIRGADNVTYNITGANPAPAIGQRAVRLSGIPSRRVHYCQQGVVLINITWTYTDQACPR